MIMTGAEEGVVDGGLGKDCRGEAHGGGFVFDNGQRMAACVVKTTVSHLRDAPDGRVMAVRWP